MREPFFLLGAERAGLALIELMLAAHPEIAWGGDFDYALAWMEPEDGDWPPLVPYWQRILVSPRARRLGVEVDHTLGFAALVRSLLQQQCGVPRPSGVAGVSVHSHYGRVLRLWPNARFIHLSRSASAPFAAGTGEARLVYESNLAWRALAAQVPAERRLELRYEVLLAHAQIELARLCGFLALPFDPELRRAPATAVAPPSAARAEAPPARVRARASRLARELGRRVAQLLG